MSRRGEEEEEEKAASEATKGIHLVQLFFRTVDDRRLHMPLGTMGIRTIGGRKKMSSVEHGSIRSEEPEEEKMKVG